MGYGIKKLHINAVIEDDKVSVDDLEEKITGFEDFVSIFFVIYSLLKYLTFELKAGY